MKNLLHDWNSLDLEHRLFILRVDKSNGGKHGVAPSIIDKGKDLDGNTIIVNLWDKSEASGFIECVGSYKWITTAKFRNLTAKLYGVDLKENA